MAHSYREEFCHSTMLFLMRIMTMCACLAFNDNVLVIISYYEIKWS